MNKVDYYYNRLIEYANFLFPNKIIKSLSSNKTPIKRILAKIIEDNNEHFLTNSYMYYLILDSMCIFKIHFSNYFRDNLYQKLVNITLGENEQIKDIIFYINLIENDETFYFRYPETEIKRVKYLLDEDIKKLFNDYHNSLLRLKVNARFEDDDYRIVLYSFKIICALCVINKNYNEYNSIVENIFNDLDCFLERLKLNGEYIFYFGLCIDKLINGVKYILDNKKILIK